ncbi:hypothetical protein L5M43_12775 [Shewanella sp. SW36]|uniref:hypothetical protein n=1 Tax=unclassified Shewanella TaxID=196818 RepID=UPI0021D9CD26|nr:MULTISPECIES: hypothetical protein [unclassified Shewanella]MCU7976126.1 hypothetical protein [Shewanella sp. SW36]MCU7988929.1 hypothetical protein [Shewanella sp. SW1]MCU8050605.1 hypothetical protein [Shewanella sp. SM43]
MFDPECLICCLEGGAACSVHGQVSRADGPVVAALTEMETAQVTLLMMQAKQLMLKAMALKAKSNMPNSTQPNVPELSAATSERAALSGVNMGKDIACFHGHTTAELFKRTQVGRMVEVLRSCDELQHSRPERLAVIATDIVDKALLGSGKQLLLPTVSIDWIMNYLLMEEQRAERSIALLAVDKGAGDVGAVDMSAANVNAIVTSRNVHIKRRDFFSQLRSNLAHKVYLLGGEGERAEGNGAHCS